MKLGANPESGFNAVANAELGLTPLSEISECQREGCSPPYIREMMRAILERG